MPISPGARIPTSINIILKEINPDYSLEGLMLKLKIQESKNSKNQLTGKDWKIDTGKDWKAKGEGGGKG